MIKLIKYEFIKKSKLFLILLAVCLIANIILGLAFGITGLTVFLVFLPIVLVIIYTYELIKTYSDDLNKNIGYMIFLTPNSGYTIIAAKLIFTLLIALIFFVSYLIFVAGNLSILVISEFSASEFSEMYRMLIANINEFFKNSIGFNIGDLVLVLLITLMGMIVFTLTIYSSITLRKSIFSNIKYGAFISFAIFILLNIIIGKGSDIITNTNDVGLIVHQINNTITYAYPSAFMTKVCLINCAYSLVVCVILILGSGYLLEHKINL